MSHADPFDGVGEVSEGILTSVTLAPIPGKPAPQGSKHAFVRKGKPILVDNAPGLGNYRTDVRAAAAQAMGEFPPHPGEVSLSIAFVMERPKSHLTSKGAIAKGAPAFPAKPDVDKCARAVMDGLTGYLFRDDSQVTDLKATKWYATDGGGSRTHIRARWYEKEG